jgi:hypothetical protein
MDLAKATAEKCNIRFMGMETFRNDPFWHPCSEMRRHNPVSARDAAIAVQRSFYSCTDIATNLRENRMEFMHLNDYSTLKLVFGHFLHEEMLKILPGPVGIFVGLREPPARLKNRFMANYRKQRGLPPVDLKDELGDTGGDLLQSPQDQSQHGLRRPDGRNQTNRRAYLARLLHGLRSGLLRRRDLQTRTAAKTIRSKSVTYVSGINCYPCVRNGPALTGGAGGIRTLDTGLSRITV